MNLMRYRPDPVTNVGSVRVPTWKPHLTGLRVGIRYWALSPDFVHDEFIK